MEKKFKFLMMCLLCVVSTSAFAQDKWPNVGYQWVDGIIEVPYIDNGGNCCVEIDFAPQGQSYEYSGFFGDIKYPQQGVANRPSFYGSFNHYGGTSQEFIAWMFVNSDLSSNFGQTWWFGTNESKTCAISTKIGGTVPLWDTGKIYDLLGNHTGTLLRRFGSISTALAQVAGTEEKSVSEMNWSGGKQPNFGSSYTNFTLMGGYNVDPSLGDLGYTFFINAKLYRFLVTPPTGVTPAKEAYLDYIPVYNLQENCYGLYQRTSNLDHTPAFFKKSGPGDFTSEANQAVTYTRKVTANNYGTICLPFEVDIKEQADNMSFYTILGKNNKTLYIAEVKDKLEAGKPYLMKSTTSNATVKFKLTGTKGADLNNTDTNGLIGSYKRTELKGDYVFDAEPYILQGNKLKKADTSGAFVGNNKAWIDMSKISGVGTMDITAKGAIELEIEGEATGIESINNSQLTTDNAKHNLQGVRVSDNYKGVVINNGKKYMVK